MKFRNMICNRFVIHYGLKKFDTIKRLHKTFILLNLLIISAGINGCKKIVQVPAPINSITTAETFSTINTANSAVEGIYSNMSNLAGNLSFGNGACTVFPGMSADELNHFGQEGNDPYLNNTLQANDGNAQGAFWTPAYFDIYMANAAIEGLQASETLPTGTKDQLTGEAKFIRAFCHFYLVNYFGDVPLITSTSWQANSLMQRTQTAQVYQQIIQDLTDAQKLLSADYSISNGERTRANSWAATALLARVYLYQKKWSEAETQATNVINNSTLFSLVPLSSSFLKNNSEAILQLQTTNLFPYATAEAQQFIPVDFTSTPMYYLTDQLLRAFEPGDRRRQAWVDSTNYSGVFYYFPYKYKVLIGDQSNITEYYTVLRLAEQYLIRAEARAQQGVNLSGAVNDLNVIRTRAGLPGLSTLSSRSEILKDVEQERKIELFAEWGHRWLDLKRTGQADAVLAPIKPQWKSTAKLYPIPLSEIQTDPNLTQNPGY